jgi:WD40 repeat protein/predicted Ser/Thr protein kinase
LTGQTISRYRIVEKLGEGGMGVVNKAEDTKLARTVALKFLGAHLLGNAEAKQRFLREAQAAAALRHPNICTVYEIDEAEGRTFIAMAFLEGDSLEQKIAGGPLPIKELLDIGQQAAKGLQAAHEKGILHRDIKPANILIDATGHATIMDFGLARLTEASRLTKADTTMGTVAYMSPEQAQGGEVDPRSDLWALGVVLYEMTCGRPPFQGHYDQALLYEICSQEPEPLTALRTGVPMELEILVSKCLAKDRDGRPATGQEIARDLRTLSEKLKSGRSTILKASAGTQRDAPVGTVARTIGGTEKGAQGVALPKTTAGVPPPKWKRGLPWALFAVAALVAMAVSFIHLRQTPPPEPPTRRFSFVPENLQTGIQAGIKLASISPDGRHIVYATVGEDGRLWVRDLDREDPRPLEGTEGGIQPFWSRDSEFIGFVTAQELKKVAAKGGPATVVCALPGRIRVGGAWSPDGETIVFASGSTFPVLYEVPARGGTPKLLFEPETGAKGPGNSSPHFLPPTAAAPGLLFEIGSSTDHEIAVKNLATGETQVLAAGAFAVYSPSGYILYQTAPAEAGLWALPFSIETLRPTGEPFPIVQNATDVSGAQDGTLAYVDFREKILSQLVWRDRSGARLAAVGRPETTLPLHVALSPDGRRVAASPAEAGARNIWVTDIGSGLRTPLTFGKSPEMYPVWSPTGREIVFASRRAEGTAFDMLSLPADGSGEPAPLVAGTQSAVPTSWSGDGQHLIYTVGTGGAGGGLDI